VIGLYSFWIVCGLFFVLWGLIGSFFPYLWIVVSIHDMWAEWVNKPKPTYKNKPS